MREAAHPQHDDAVPAGKAAGTAVKNPFPVTMTVPDVNGDDLAVDLAVVGGVVHAPGLDDLPVSPEVRQYVINYCAAWSSSVLTAEQSEVAWRPPESPRRAAITIQESQLHAMFGLAADERVLRVVPDPYSGTVHFVVESPRLPPLPPLWIGLPPTINLPVAAWYEGREQA